MSATKNISLFIPHVFSNFSKEYVAEVFSEYGVIDHVDFVAKQDREGKDYNAVYIHFKQWYDDYDNRLFEEKLSRESQVRVYHDGPWYWIVLPNTAKKHVSGDRKPRLDLGDAKAISASSIASTLAPSPSNIAPTLLTTPVKGVSVPKCPGAPMKKSYAAAMAKQSEKQCLTTSFDEVAAYEAEIEAEMDEIEEVLDTEDQNLVTIDGRYVQTIEQENWAMTQEIAQLRAALINLDLMYQAEAAKVRAFTNVEL
jgi:hypothetical protein